MTPIEERNAKIWELRQLIGICLGHRARPVETYGAWRWTCKKGCTGPREVQTEDRAASGARAHERWHEMRIAEYEAEIERLRGSIS